MLVLLLLLLLQESMPVTKYLVPVINTVGVIRTMIYEYIQKGHVLPYLLRLPQHSVD